MRPLRGIRPPVILLALVVTLTCGHRPALAAERTPVPGTSRTAQPASLPVTASWITDAAETVQPNPFKLPHNAPPGYVATCASFLESKWVQATKRSLQAYVDPEKAYFQEKDVFGFASRIGNYIIDGPEVPICWMYVVTLGHLSGAGPRTS